MKLQSMELMRPLGRWWVGIGCVVVAALVAGCSTSSSGDNQHFAWDPLAGQTAPPEAPATGGDSGAVSSAPAAGGTTSVTNALRVGDTLVVTYSDTVNQINPSQVQIAADGTITLLFNEKFQAAGKNPAQLQADVRDRYVPKYFRTLTATVLASDRFFVVEGEVRMPNRYVYTGHMTVLEAIATAGGFTDFSKRTKVQVTRTDHSHFTVDCKAAVNHPDLNLEIFPGDIVHVKKRFLFE